MDIDARIEGLVSKDGNKILLFAVQCNAINFLVGGVENTNRAEAEATSAAYAGPECDNRLAVEWMWLESRVISWETLPYKLSVI